MPRGGCCCHCYCHRRDTMVIARPLVPAAAWVCAFAPLLLCCTQPARLIHIARESAACIVSGTVMIYYFFFAHFSPLLLSLKYSLELLLGEFVEKNVIVLFFLSNNKNNIFHASRMRMRVGGRSAVALVAASHCSWSACLQENLPLTPFSPLLSLSSEEHHGIDFLLLLEIATTSAHTQNHTQKHKAVVLKTTAKFQHADQFQTACGVFLLSVPFNKSDFSNQ